MVPTRWIPEGAGIIYCVSFGIGTIAVTPSNEISAL